MNLPFTGEEGILDGGGKINVPILTTREKA